MACKTFWKNRLEIIGKKRVNLRSTTNISPRRFLALWELYTTVGIALGGRVPNKESLAHAFDSIFGENY
jgi:hypothetical protein